MRSMIMTRPSLDLLSAAEASDAPGIATMQRALLEAIAAHDRQEEWRRDGAPSMTAWLCDRLRLSPETAGEWVRTARGLAAGIESVPDRGGDGPEAGGGARYPLADPFEREAATPARQPPTRSTVKTQQKVPVTQPHSVSSTAQSLARPPQRSADSKAATQKWQDLASLTRPSAKRLE